MFLLALGMGTNVGVFSLTQAILLRPLPYAEPERLVRISGESPESASAVGGAVAASLAPTRRALGVDPIIALREQ